MASKPAPEIYLLKVSALLNPFMDQKKNFVFGQFSCGFIKKCENSKLDNVKLKFTYTC